jgi:hypothetical protein
MKWAIVAAIPIAGLRYFHGLLRACGAGFGTTGWPLDPRVGRPWQVFDCQGERAIAEEPFGDGRAAPPR